ncbi:MAG: circularly permuted type 2 ATP-grasp protein [Methylobacter sp.]|nr:circularly permuted type 2 ATP-grasp protein [Methylobacter sp.]MDP2098937.1 circularly permuted type 2 ATP-grasp protein [Methylobacter sp.]MDP2427911.1 circularly permuted type 2 ATP-grasp protein [Methylobacter sp.]MDP3054991.1 circularly permuted type 2 ATP-grasp protein [Methylobacter sp.]MDP3362888.1 circularly permuted type 2 ATP-grasp protein [Methylobacter sp.]
MNASVNDIGVQFYATQLGVYDEMLAKEHKVLPHWERFMDAMGAMGSEQLESCRREAQRLLRENGVTYNVYGDSQKLTRPWRLDPVPLLISSDEWRLIEAGLQQRAELLDLVLKDIYGKQQLLKKGLLPSELVLAHDGFLHPCVGALPHQQRHLIVYSANLARGHNGRMWVLDDRSQAPSGAGYALENRTVMTRVLPDIFRETQVHRLSVFFKALRKGLADSAPHNKEDPRIVILTPGSLNETYFEHAYLSSYLGFSLVQGDDLTVRDGRVWLKSLDGLQPVDVILRRVDDSFCDPLELRSASRLGVAGLLEAVRRNNVAIANPLGSSVLENPGLLAFLPRLSRYFLNQELLLPSVATWWCGQRRERDFVLQNLDRLVIKPINRSAGHHVLFGGALSSKEKERLRAAIITKPHCYVGQEHVSFSTVPALVDHHIEPRFAVLRNFVVAGGDGYQVMPGGLTRVARQQDDFIVSNQAGGISKDTWVLADEPDRQVSLWLQTGRNVVLSPVTEPLTSRAANNLFWVGRHLERIKTSTRLLRTIVLKLTTTLESDDPLNSQSLSVLLCALTQVTGTYPGFIKSNADVLKQPQHELLDLAKNAQRAGTLTANIQAFAQTAFSIRDAWSQDTWRCVDNIQRRWQQRVVNNECDLEQLQKHLDDLMTGFVAFIGLTTESMTREAGWLMLDSGRRLEGSLALVALLRATVVQRHEPALQNQLLEAVLVSTDSLSIYRRRYRSFIQLPMVLELLLQDETHPRSLVYQLQQLSNHIGALPRERGNGRLSEEERLILRAYTDLRLLKVSELIQADDEASVYSELESVLSALTTLLWQLYEVLAQAYFSHSQMPQLMTPTQAEDEL